LFGEKEFQSMELQKSLPSRNNADQVEDGRQAGRKDGNKKYASAPSIISFQYSYCLITILKSIHELPASKHSQPASDMMKGNT